MTDDDFLAALEAATLPAAAFRHRDHVRAGYLYLTRLAFPEAIARMTASIKGFAAANGKDGLYHATITLAYMTVINERLVLQGDGGGWPGFAANNADLLDKRFLCHYYRPETLMSDHARRVFVLGEFSPTPYETA